MVRSIAEENNIKMPGFFGYMGLVNSNISTYIFVIQLYLVLRKMRENINKIINLMGQQR